MTLGQFINPLQQQQERLAGSRQQIGNSNLEAQQRSALLDALSNAPNRFAQGEKIAQERNIRQGTQQVFNTPGQSPSQRLTALSEAAGRAGDPSLATNLQSAAGGELDKERKRKVEDLTTFSSIIDSAYTSELEKTKDKDKALKKANELLASLYDSGLGESVKPALDFLVESGRSIPIGGKSSKKTRPIEASTKSGQLALVDPDTYKVTLVYQDNGDPALKYQSSDLAGKRAAATAEAKVKVSNTAQELRRQGYVPATLKYMRDDNLSKRIVTSSDTDEEFVKLRQIPAKDVSSLTQLENVQDRLVLAVDKLKQYGIEPDPITGRLPIIGESLTELSKTPEFKEVRADFGRILNDYRKAITGAQASFAEIGAIKSTIPNLETADTETIIRNAVSLFNEIEDKKSLSLNNLEDAGFDIVNLIKDRKKFDISNDDEKALMDREFNSFDEVNSMADELGLKKGDIVTVNGKRYQL